MFVRVSKLFSLFLGKQLPNREVVSLGSMRLSKFHDDLWMCLVADRSSAAFGKFYAATWGEVFGFCAETLHDRDAAEEAVQLTYVELWEWLSTKLQDGLSTNLHESAPMGKELTTDSHGFKPKGGALAREGLDDAPPTGAFPARQVLERVASRNVDLLRKRFVRELERRVDLELAYNVADRAPLPTDSAVRREIAAKLRRLVLDLPGEDRAAFTMHYYEGLSQGRIAQEMGLDRPAVNRLIARALQRLRMALEPGEKPNQKRTRMG